MDNRKLKADLVITIHNEGNPEEMTEIVVEGGHPTIGYLDPDIAEEAVNRFNKYPDILSQRDELTGALTELELRATQARIASNIGQPRLKDADFLRGEMERIASHARTILSKLSQP